MLELAKALKLVAPITMSADAQLVWLQAAVDALEGIHAHEVAAVSLELRRSVTRPAQIVPEIWRLVSEKRKSAGERARRQREDEAERLLPRPKPHISDRDRRNFVAADWAELNEYLERIGAGARYHPDGTRYATTAGISAKNDLSHCNHT